MFTRENEQRLITKFLTANIRKRKSGLMYLCGHPGTGKTSSLNQILATLRRAAAKGKINEFQMFMYNAMPFTDVKAFGLSLLQEVTERKTGFEVDRMGRQAFDDEELA